MRRMIIAAIAVLIAIGSVTFEGRAAENCMIGDSALCLADPDCHWDASRRGCYAGPRPSEDACAVHGDKGVCEADIALGCKWAAEQNKCAVKTN